MAAFDLIFAVASTVILFLYGLSSFSREIRDLGEAGLRRTLQAATANRMLGFAAGAGFTAIVQSRSAVTSLAVALVDSGVITFSNSLGILVGANVGTTATAWLVSFRLTGIGPIFIVLGALFGVLPSPLRVIGKAVFYFGFIFFALDLVSNSLDPLKDSERLPAMLAHATNPIIGALIGAVLTAVVQSSSVVTGLSILLVQQGTIETQAAVSIIVGANLGSAATALIASIPMSRAAKRSAQANAILNGGGVLLFLPLTYPLTELVTSLSDNAGISVALAHLIFNLTVAAIALAALKPLGSWLGPEDADGCPGGDRRRGDDG